MAAACTRHIHRGPEDYRPSGACIHCSREGQRAYGKSCRAARRRLKAIEALMS
jgi:hypothetical protein